MADWIRMRSNLLTNPRVIRMARLLLADAEFLAFLAWPVPGDLVTARDESVTARHVPVVTRIVVGGLLPTWSAVNDTVSRNGIVRHATLREVDDMAGIPGFGRALVAVNWLEVLTDEEGVRFVNFEEHNSPQKERSSTAKTSAERQAEYRARKKSGGDGALRESDAHDEHNGDVTRDVTRYRREEESREDKKNPTGSKRTPKVPKPRRSTVVPEDFAVSPEMVTWAAVKAPLVNWQRETEKFRDHEFKRPYTNWPSTWRMWMRNAQETAEAGGPPGRRGARTDNGADLLAGAI